MTDEDRERFGFKRFRVTAGIDKDDHIIVTVSEYDCKKGERIAVANAAWDKLMENERDEDGMLTKNESPTARMLKALCKQVPGGAVAVRQKFRETIVYREEVKRHARFGVRH